LSTVNRPLADVVCRSKVSSHISTSTFVSSTKGDICPGNLDPSSKLFIVLFALSGLGFFCGPLLEVASSWTNHVPGGLATLASLTVGLGVVVFSNIEGVSHSEAFYASIITGTSCRRRVNQSDVHLAVCLEIMVCPADKAVSCLSCLLSKGQQSGKLSLRQVRFDRTRGAESETNSFDNAQLFSYGDLTPRSDVGKLAVAFYAIMVVNVVAGLLKPGRMYLEELCHVPKAVTMAPVQATVVASKGKLVAKKED
jgi:hypothetical protein